MPKIYIFYTSKDDEHYDFVALAEDGTCLWPTWRSPSEECAKTEMRSPEKLERYNVHYPEGWELV